MFIFSVSYPPVRAFSDSGRRLRPRTEQRSCRSAIPAKLSARWQKNAVQRHGARHFVTRLKSGFRGARRTRGCSQSGDLRFLPLFGQRLTAVSARRVFCPFGPQKTANRGLRPRKLMYFLTAKSTKNSPTDAFAYFVPSNVRPPKRRILGGCANIHKTGALSLGAEQEQPTACVPGAGGWQRRPQARADSVLFAEPPQPLRRVFLRRKGLILLRPLNAGRRRLPRRTTCGWFWCYLLPSKGLHPAGEGRG